MLPHARVLRAMDDAILIRNFESVKNAWERGRKRARFMGNACERGVSRGGSDRCAGRGSARALGLRKCGERVRDQAQGRKYERCRDNGNKTRTRHLARHSINRQ